MGDVLEFRSRKWRQSPVDPRAEFGRVMEKLFEAVDLIDDGKTAVAREAILAACEVLLHREEGIFVWPKK